jgi:hypothetical protein
MSCPSAPRVLRVKEVDQIIGLFYSERIKRRPVYNGWQTGGDVVDGPVVRTILVLPSIEADVEFIVQCSVSLSGCIPAEFIKSAKVSALSCGRPQKGSPRKTTVRPLDVSNISQVCSPSLWRSKRWRLLMSGN